MGRRDGWAGAVTGTAAAIVALAAVCLALPGVGLVVLGWWWRAGATALLAFGIVALAVWRFESASAPAAQASEDGAEFTLVSFNAL